MAKRNLIIEADERDDDVADTSTDLNDAEEGDDFDPTVEELTDEDVVAEVRKMDNESQARVNKSRHQGSAAGATRQRGTPQRAASKARNPVRARPVEWRETESLDAPTPRPGMEQRWVRFQIGTEEDAKNMTRKMRNYWAPRTIDSIPEGFFPPTVRHAQLGSVIGVGDLILCERPREVGISRKKHFAGKLKRQTQAGQRHVRNVEQEGHEIEVTNRRERPTVGYGPKRRVKVQDDE